MGHYSGWDIIQDWDIIQIITIADHKDQRSTKTDIKPIERGIVETINNEK